MSKRGADREASAVFVEEEHWSNPCVRRPIGALISRRNFLRGAAATAASLGPASVMTRLAQATQRSPAQAEVGKSESDSSLTFRELPHGNSQTTAVADGYQIQVLLRWGDPVVADAGAFDPHRQTAQRQRTQFGYNCDYTAFIPLPPAEDGSLRGLLAVNHEYTNTNLMFSGINNFGDLEGMSKEQVDVELAAHGHTLCEIQQVRGQWQVVVDSPLNRRLTALDTEMRISGPAAGHPRLRTGTDPTGRRVLGTLNNCAGGVTPWGTILICEENFNGYFSGDPEKTSEHRNHLRYGINGVSRFNPAWARHYDRFDIEKEPHEPNRFGWVVEYDPLDPEFVPVKRTALGRLKHEGAGIVLNPDGRVVVYCGDDERFDYVYRFVTSEKYSPNHPQQNRNLLDEGTLSVARFEDDGRLHWLPLVHGQGPLTAEHGFDSQADVLIEARRAADLLGATPMDRPEDVEPSPVTGHVFVMLTNNSKRSEDQLNAANPRPENVHGHILELIPPGESPHLDHAADSFRWEVLLRAGNPRNAEDHAQYHPAVSDQGWLSCPDNGAFDQQGRLWITTDSDHELTGFGDGVYACDVSGSGRALTKLFFRGPRGSEVSGVCLSPDNQTLFVSVQHPGEEQGSHCQSPSTRWPDFKPDMPPRPAVVAITKRGGGVIGS